ncbi:MAG: hypothetical protein CFE43_04065 [Burkholderiales bacterium PBB3]|nr:MAG: hypothetical protein CFE43_04065 [Burkholderiales bacterium PBB3]
MKYLLLFVVVFIFAWHWRNTRRADIAKRARKVHPSPKPSADPMDMVQCAHCHVHLGQAESVQGRNGQYCSPEHRALTES